MPHDQRMRSCGAQGGSDELPPWVIPVAAGGGSLLLCLLAFHVECGGMQGKAILVQRHSNFVSDVNSNECDWLKPQFFVAYGFSRCLARGCNP